MAANKSKRSIHLAQPQPQQAKTEIQPEQTKLERLELNVNQEPTELMPVRAHVYQTIADMNGGFENAIEALQTLLKINYLRSDSLNEIQNQICQVRAQANLEFMTVLNERERANAGHFKRLRIPPKATGVTLSS